jgi:hypothetical protein
VRSGSVLKVPQICSGIRDSLALHPTVAGRDALLLLRFGRCGQSDGEHSDDS